jgi:hypothetical protein
MLRRTELPITMGIESRGRTMPEASNTASEDEIRNSQVVRTGCCGLEVTPDQLIAFCQCHRRHIFHGGRKV